MSLALSKAAAGKEWKPVFGTGVVSEDNDRLQIEGGSVVVLVTAPGRLRREKKKQKECREQQNDEK